MGIERPPGTDRGDTQPRRDQDTGKPVVRVPVGSRGAHGWYSKGEKKAFLPENSHSKP